MDRQPHSSGKNLPGNVYSNMQTNIPMSTNDNATLTLPTRTTSHSVSHTVSNTTTAAPVAPPIASLSTTATTAKDTGHTTDASRKRARDHPQPPSNQRHEVDTRIAQRLKIAPGNALNLLLQLSHNHDPAMHLTGDAILRELVHIFHKAIGWNPTTAADDNDNVNKDTPSYRSNEAWTQAPTKRQQAWIDHCKIYLGTSKRHTINPENIKTMEVIVTILRNLSFTASNLKLITYQQDVFSILVGCMHEGFARFKEDARSTLALYAMHALTNMAPYMDMSGQKIVSDRLFYTPAKNKDGPPMPETDKTFGMTQGGSWGMGGLLLAKRLDPKEDNMDQINEYLLQSLAQDYLIALWSLFAGLAHVISDTRAPRGVLLAALDLLQELINSARVGVVGAVQYEDKEGEIPGVRTVLVKMPDDVLTRLVDMLCMPRHGPHALDYPNPMHVNVNRAPYGRAADYATSIDAEMRDKALNSLVPLLELDSPRMARRLGSTFRDEQEDNGQVGKLRLYVFDAVLQCVTAKSPETQAQAATLLRELSKAPENDEGLFFLRDTIVDIASRDHRMTQVLWNHMPFSDDDEEDQDNPHEDGDAFMSEIG